MSNNKVFILQKNTPDAAAGTKYYKYSYLGNEFYYSGTSLPPEDVVCDIWPVETVENKTEWFLPEEDHEVAKAKELLRGMGYYVSLSMVEFEPVSKEFKIKSAKELLEREGYHVYKDPDVGVVSQIIANYKAAGKPYTEEDMIKCFIYAYKAGQIETWVTPDLFSKYAENYLNSLNKK
jgi:hypothetical protein